MPRDLELSFPPSEEPPELLGEARWLDLAAEKLRVPRASLAHANVVRVSFDARVRHRLWRVLLRLYAPGELAPTPPATTPPTLARPRSDAPRVAIVGSGPAGLFCALDCLASGLNVTLFERASKAEIEAEVRRCIDTAGRRSRFVLSTSCELPPRANPDCVKWMMDCAREYGRYDRILGV